MDKFVSDYVGQVVDAVKGLISPDEVNKPFPRWLKMWGDKLPHNCFLMVDPDVFEGCFQRAHKIETRVENNMVMTWCCHCDAAIAVVVKVTPDE